MICKLCLANAPLCRSHILPELVFLPLYDDKHRFIEASVSEQKIRQGQKGWWEKLLCADCESRINRYERHVRRMFVDPLPPPVFEKRTFEFSKVDYKLLKLFILSVLWRASVSTLDECRLVSLGSHEEILRKLIMDDAHVEPDIYPSMVFLVFDGQRWLTDVIPEPTYHEDGANKCYRIMMRGFLFFIYVGDHKVSPAFSPLVLGRHPAVRAFAGDWQNFAFLEKSLIEAASVPD